MWSGLDSAVDFPKITCQSNSGPLRGGFTLIYLVRLSLVLDVLPALINKRTVPLCL